MQLESIALCRRIAFCDNGHEFTFHVFSDFEYGRKTAWTPRPEDFAYIDCLNDPVCSELSALTKMLLRESNKKALEISDCFDHVLSYVCEPAPSGHRYSFAGKRWCPVCGIHQIHEYGTEFTDIVQVPHVTHRYWQGLSDEQKRELVFNALKEAGCL